MTLDRIGPCLHCGTRCEGHVCSTACAEALTQRLRAQGAHPCQWCEGHCYCKATPCLGCRSCQDAREEMFIDMLLGVQP